jgi:hypothetical protein
VNNPLARLMVWPPHRRDEAVLCTLARTGVCRQADDFIGDEVRHHQPAVIGRKVTVGLLPLQRLWIMTRGRHALAPGRGHEGVARLSLRLRQGAALTKVLGPKPACDAMRGAS